MNVALAFLRNNWRRLDLWDYGTPDRLTCVIMTPRFRASGHVVFLMMPEEGPDPVLVVKIPRLSGSNAGIEREVANLQAVQASYPGGFDSIPRVITFEAYAGRPVLVETALAGQPMDPATVRRDPVGCCNAVTDWLIEVQQPSCSPIATDPNWFGRLVEQPLRHFADAFPLSVEEMRLLERTWEVVAPLRDAYLPLVFEHGDLSHPNIVLLKNGGVGVVDWELAEPHGLPAYDLFFFLTYVAFALHKARSNGDCLPAFHEAFFGPAAWAHPYIEAHAERLQLQSHMLTPLFVLCWARYTANLLIRLGNTERSPGPLDPDTAAWLRANRYYALWRYTVDHMRELSFGIRGE
ncbi:MAG: aminoglycoside phosphotransferase family protein [Anaerolineae bacterium]